jgi:hypothetical protein
MSVHFDPRLTWGHVITTICAVFALGGAWVQLDQLGGRLERVAEAVQTSNQRIAGVENRTAVLEAQRVEDDKRLDEIRDTVIEIRRLLDARQ